MICVLPVTALLTAFSAEANETLGSKGYKRNDELWHKCPLSVEKCEFHKQFIIN